MRLKDIAVGIFAKISTDQELLDLLEVPSTSMKDIRQQIIEDKYPSDLVTTNLSRLCIYESPTSTSIYTNVERSFIQIDIYVTKEKNKLDRRILLIANRIFSLLHNSKIDNFNIKYYNRLPNMPTDNKEWIKYSVVFCYDNIVI